MDGPAARPGPSGVMNAGGAVIGLRRRFPVRASQLQALADEDAFGLGRIISPKFRLRPQRLGELPAAPHTPRQRLAAEIVGRIGAYARGDSPRPMVLLSRPSGSGKSHLLLVGAAAAQDLGLPTVDLWWHEEVRIAPRSGPLDDWLVRIVASLDRLAREGRLVCLADELSWRYPAAACQLLLETVRPRYYCLVAAHEAADEVGDAGHAYDIFDLDREYALTAPELDAVVRVALDDACVPEAVFPRALVGRIARKGRCAGRALGVASCSIGQAVDRAKREDGSPLVTARDVDFWLRLVDRRPYREWLKRT